MDRAWRYHSSSVSSCQICLERSSRPACSSSMRPQQRLAADHPGPDELAVDEHVVDDLPQVVAHPRAEGDAERGLGPVHDLVRQPALGRLLERDLALAPLDLRAAGDRERRLRHDGIDERDAHLDRGRHAGPVRVGEVEPRQEQARVGQAHPVDLVRQRVVVVDVAVLLDHVVHVAGEVRADEGGQLAGVVERVAAAEPRLLRQLGERQEALRPARVAQAAAGRADREAVHGGAHDSARERRAACGTCWP